eukprot:6183217-Pleurochrysis_carterae.AAC.2
MAFARQCSFHSQRAPSIASLLLKSQSGAHRRDDGCLYVEVIMRSFFMKYRDTYRDERKASEHASKAARSSMNSFVVGTLRQWWDAVLAEAGDDDVNARASGHERRVRAVVRSHGS